VFTVPLERSMPFISLYRATCEILNFGMDCVYFAFL